jgi:hypothetical protein
MLIESPAFTSRSAWLPRIKTIECYLELENRQPVANAAPRPFGKYEEPAPASTHLARRGHPSGVEPPLWFEFFRVRAPDGFEVCQRDGGDVDELRKD